MQKAICAVFKTACIVPLAVLSLSLLPGCGTKCENLGRDREKLDKLLAESNKPVIVDFYKWGCATCWAVDPVMDKLAEEYRGRAVVARFWMCHFWFTPTDWEVFKRYSFGFFPTVIMFVDGKEQHRWVWDTNADNYRKVLDEQLQKQATGKGTGPATQPESVRRIVPATQPQAAPGPKRLVPAPTPFFTVNPDGTHTYYATEAELRRAVTGKKAPQTP